MAQTHHPTCISSINLNNHGVLFFFFFLFFIEKYLIYILVVFCCYFNTFFRLYGSKLRRLAPYYRKGVTFSTQRERERKDPFLPSIPQVDRASSSSAAQVQSPISLHSSLKKKKTKVAHQNSPRGLCIHKHSQTMWRQVDLSLLLLLLTKFFSFPLCLRPCAGDIVTAQAPQNAGVQPTVCRHRSQSKNLPRFFFFIFIFFFGSIQTGGHYLTRTCAAVKGQVYHFDCADEKFYISIFYK